MFQAQISIHDFDIICLSETFLNSDYSLDDPRLNDGYDILRCDHPSDTKRGGVCVYFKDFLNLKRRDDISTLDECIICEIKVGNAKYFLSCMYRTPSQSEQQLADFCLNFENICQNISDESPLCS